MRDPAPESDLKETPPTWMTKIVGGVTLWVGVAFGALLCWSLYRLASPSARSIDMPIVVFLGAVAVIALFCLSVGYRLFFNRPSPYGSILGPVGWRICGGFLGLWAVALAGAALFTEVYASKPEVWPSILFLGASSYSCFRTLARLSRHGTRGESAL